MRLDCHTHFLGALLHLRKGRGWDRSGGYRGETSDNCSKYRLCVLQSPWLSPPPPRSFPRSQSPAPEVHRTSCSQSSPGDFSTTKWSQRSSPPCGESHNTWVTIKFTYHIGLNKTDNLCMCFTHSGPIQARCHLHRKHHHGCFWTLCWILQKIYKSIKIEFENMKKWKDRW